MAARDLPSLDQSLARLNHALPVSVRREQIKPSSIPVMVAHLEQWRTLLRGELVDAHRDREPRVGAEQLLASLAFYEEQSAELMLRGPGYRERVIREIAHQLQVSEDDIRSAWHWWDSVVTSGLSALLD